MNGSTVPKSINLLLIPIHRGKQEFPECRTAIRRNTQAFPGLRSNLRPDAVRSNRSDIPRCCCSSDLWVARFRENDIGLPVTQDRMIENRAEKNRQSSGGLFIMYKSSQFRKNKHNVKTCPLEIGALASSFGFHCPIRTHGRHSFLGFHGVSVVPHAFSSAFVYICANSRILCPGIFAWGGHPDGRAVPGCGLDCSPVPGRAFVFRKWARRAPV